MLFWCALLTVATAAAVAAHEVAGTWGSSIGGSQVVAEQISNLTTDGKSLSGGEFLLTRTVANGPRARAAAERRLTARLVQ